jgi:hypothetical protein
MKIKYDLINLILIVLLVNVAYVYSQKEVDSKADGLFYFPSNTTDVGLEVNDKLDDSRNNYYSRFLFNMNEPVLFNMLNANVYRYTNVGEFSKVYSIRLELKKGKVIMDYKETVGNGGNIFEVFKNYQKVLPKKVWHKLVEKVDSCQFWSMTSYRRFTDILTFGGANFILEGVSSNKYHFVMRHNPKEMREEKYAALCNYIESLVNE